MPVADTGQGQSKTSVHMSVGEASIKTYSRLSYTMWHALAEFIDNSTQSRLNHESIIDDVLSAEGTPLIIDILHNKMQKTLTISDNSIGMNLDDLKASLQIARPTANSKGRSKYGMGMKTAACWIGNHWSITTTEYASGKEHNVEIDVDKVADGEDVVITSKDVDSSSHYTKIKLTNLNRVFKQQTEETIRSYLSSMYRFDLASGKVRITFNGQELFAPGELNIDTDNDGSPMKIEFQNARVGDKMISGWVAVLKKGGRKLAGFSIFQNQRQIQGYPTAWKPNSMFGGVEEEGANNLVAQRLAGLINLDEYVVSHTKDKIIFYGDEEERLETFLADLTKGYREYAQNRRGERVTTWTREKVRELARDLASEFSSPEVSNALKDAVLPPLELINQANDRQVASVTEEQTVASFVIANEITVVISIKEQSENDPYVVISQGADPQKIYIIINRIHPYYESLDTADEVRECLRQYVYDGISEYKAMRRGASIQPKVIRKLKDDLLRAKDAIIENAAAALQGGSERESVNIE